MTQHLSVNPITHGTVIDHVHKGMALKLLQFLHLDQIPTPFFVGVHLPSKLLGLKDIIKLEHVELTEKQMGQIAIFSPMATVNLIREGKITEKVRVKMPESVEGVINCHNPTCITNSEPVKTTFVVHESKDRTFLTCIYCERTFPHEAWIGEEVYHG